MNKSRNNYRLGDALTEEYNNNDKVACIHKIKLLLAHAAMATKWRDSGWGRRQAKTSLQERHR